MEESNVRLENNSHENYSSLSKKPIVKKLDDYMSPKRNNSPLMKKNDNFVTPSRNNGFIKCHTPGTPFSQTPIHDFMIETPNGSKIPHPVLANNIRNFDKCMTSPNFFTISNNSIKDDSVLSPDLAGLLFPVEIDVDVDAQYYLEIELRKKYEKYCNKKADLFFQNGTVAPSPDTYDSGVGASLQTSNLSVIESERNSFAPSSLLCHNTPPSKYKWNRDEYRAVNCSLSPVSYCYNESMDDDDASVDVSSNHCNLESTKIFDNSFGLAFNLSMRDHSIIRKSVFDSDNEEIGGCGSFTEYRSSPNGGFSSSAMDDLEISPIKHDLHVVDSDEEIN